MISSIYYKIKYSIEKFIIRRLFKIHPNKLIKSKFLGGYIHSELGESEIGDIWYIASELARSGVIYEYFVNDKFMHAHSFDELLFETIKTDGNIDFGEIDQYSHQEYEFLIKLSIHRKIALEKNKS